MAKINLVTCMAAAEGDGKGEERKTLSLAFLLPITPRVLLKRDSERRLGTSEVSLYDDHKLALSDKRILYLIGKYKSLGHFRVVLSIAVAVQYLETGRKSQFVHAE